MLLRQIIKRRVQCVESLLWVLPGALLENFLRKSWAASDYESDLFVGGQLRPHPKVFVYLMIKRYTSKKVIYHDL